MAGDGELNAHKRQPGDIPVVDKLLAAGAVLRAQTKRHRSSVSFVGQFYAEVLVDVERASLDDQPLSQLEVDAPVARLVSVGQRRASDRRADAHVVKLAGLSRQTHFDIAQALAVGQLREGHDAKLLGATEAARPVIAAVSIDDAVEGLPRQEVHGLREQGLAEVHGDSGVAKPGTLAQTAISDSQVGDTLCHPESRAAIGLLTNTSQVNRTVLITDY